MRTSVGVLVLAILAWSSARTQAPFHPDIPKAWDDAAVAGFEVPLAQADRSPRYPTAAEYYAMKVRPIYRSYPAYAKDREPAGYRDALLQKDPEIIFDPAKLQTKDDWIAAGKLVFESETRFRPAKEPPVAAKSRWPVSKDGVLPWFEPGNRYFIRQKGLLETGVNACSDCHTRVMPDGSYLEGAQGMPGLPPSPEAIEAFRNRPDAAFKNIDSDWINFGAPWVQSKEAMAAELTKDEIVRRFEATRPGVFPRQGTSTSHPVRVPSLIGLGDLKYLDATGLVRNRSIGDIMRYAIVNEGLDTLAYYGDFQPAPGATLFSGDDGTRYSDEELYALALYLLSLKPPPNPNPFNDAAQRGQKIFAREGCPVCHTPPLYTNNKLTPALGFTVPDELRTTDDIMSSSQGTDPTLALKTRRGTGFYKVPSLRGLWYRSAFGHGGEAATLEEWFDPARLENAYVAKGFHLGPGPIRGHQHGLDLSPDAVRDLIAFLKTL